MTLYLPDTHAILWHEVGDARLSVAARQAFAEAAAGRAAMICHPIVLAEFYGVLKKAGRESAHLPYVRAVLADPNYRYESLSAADLQRIIEFSDVPEMHDRLIAVTAVRLGATVITRDREIRNSSKVRCLW